MITPSLKTLLADIMELTLGWRLGSLVESKSRSGYQWFTINSDWGACSFIININEEKATLQENRKLVCIKKYGDDSN